MFGLRLSRGSRGLSLRLRFKVGVEVKVKVKVKSCVKVRGVVEVKVKGVKVYICPIDESTVPRHCRRFLVEIRSSRRSNASTVKLIRGFEL